MIKSVERKRHVVGRPDEVATGAHLPLVLATKSPRVLLRCNMHDDSKMNYY